MDQPGSSFAFFTFTAHATVATSKDKKVDFRVDKIFISLMAQAIKREEQKRKIQQDSLLSILTCHLRTYANSKSSP